MGPFARSSARSIVLAALALAAAPVATAATLDWSAAGALPLGGAGTWNTTSDLWTADGGSTWAAWNNSANDVARFGGTAGTVTLGTGITANGLTFATTGYTVTGNTITLGGSSPTLTTDTGVSATLSSTLALSGATAVTKAGAGDLTLTANSSYSGNTTVSGGTLTLGDGAALPNTTAISVASGATLNLNGNNSNQIQSGFTRDSENAASLAISGTMNVRAAAHTMYAWTISATNGTINFTNLNGYLWMPTRTITFNGGSNAVTGTSNLGLHLAPSSATLTLATPLATDAVSINASLTAGGAGNFTKSGAGLVSLQGANNRIGSAFSGVWTVAGTLGVSDGTAHTVYGSGITLNNGSLASLGAGNTGNGSFLFNATKTITANGSQNFITGSNVVGIASGQTLTLSTPQASDALTVSGNILLPGSVSKTGSGTVVFSGANTYGGTTTISAGTLQVGAGGSTGVLGAGAVTNNATLRFNRSDSITVANAITGSGAVIKDGADQLLFNSVKEYTGGTVVNGGTLSLAGAGGETGIIRGSLTINAGATVESGVSGTTNWALGFGGAASGVAVSNIVINGGTLTFGTAGGVSGISAATVEMTGGSIGGQPWDWYYGTSSQNRTPTLTTLAASTTATVDGLLLRLGSFSGNGASLTFDVAAGNVTGGATPGVDLLVGAIADKPIIDFGAAVIKTGSGVLRFSGSNTYTGPTTISAGTLLVDGGLLSTSSLSVAAGARLGGSGLIATTIAGAGLVSPGNSPGITTANAVDPTGGLDFAFEFTAPGSPDYGTAAASINDVLRLTAATPFTASLTGSNVIDVYFDVTSLDAGATFRGGFYTDTRSDFLGSIEDATYAYWVRGNGSGADRSFNGQGYYSLSSFDLGLSVTLSTVPETANFGSGDVNGQVMQFVVVPEPGTLALASLGLALAIQACRRGAHRP